MKHYLTALEVLSRAVGVTKEISFRAYLGRVKFQIPSEGETLSYQNE